MLEQDLRDKNNSRSIRRIKSRREGEGEGEVGGGGGGGVRGLGSN